MTGEQRRDGGGKSEIGTRTSPGRPALSSGAPYERRERESEAPTRPRGRTIEDSDLPAESLPSVSTPALYAPQDSFHPVRVSARSVRPPLSSWTRTWGTVALVIVLAGGAIGVVTSLRARTLSAARLRNDAARAAQISSERGTEAKDAPNRGAPAAAPVFAAPTPVAPAAAANRSAAASAANAEAAPTASLHAAPSVRPSPTAVIYRTPESLAVSPPSAPSAAPAHARRTKPADAPPKPAVTKWRTEESVQEPTPAPATPDVPEKKGESEAWVTEERRF